MAISRSKTYRRTAKGFTLVEFVVAIVVLGIAISGLFPLIIMQYRTFQRLIIQTGCQDETYYQDKTPSTSINWDMKELYITPYVYLHQPEVGWRFWARKLGASALLTTDEIPAISIPANPVLEVQSSSTKTEHYDEPEGGWYDKNATERIHDMHSEEGKEPAVWLFTNVPPGYYYLKATWTANTSDPALQSDHATYLIYDGSSLETENAIGNQQVDANDATLAGGPWLITNKNVYVYLYAQTDAAVVAGKLRLVPRNTYTLNSTPEYTKTTITEDGVPVNAWSAVVHVKKQ